MTPLELTQYYFNVSNESNFEEIKKIFTPTSTYSSVDTGLYLWVDDIIKMQEKFHSSFEELSWRIKDINEVKPWIICVEFDFQWVKKWWEKIMFSWLEYVVVYKWHIQHIEIKNK